ncbi:hypothetical protein [Novilysobacter luteus]|uniref:Uncharacterized protein n=1 Tax=Novilysobacter luteus TaxID=2822368 RepID=A0ABM8UCC5_9GAMM|nr:hypothetical protein [Lysobacter luteus]CAG4968439.1 hypothetical protein LYB30171_00271 [Lysobacter luteus]
MTASADRHSLPTKATFFVCFQAVPTTLNTQYSAVGGAYAACWVVAANPEAAYTKARFFVAKSEWEVVGVETPPTEVVETSFEGREIGLIQFRTAQTKGIAIVYTCWSKDGLTEAGPMAFDEPGLFDLNAYVGSKKKLSRTGRCFHPESGDQCGEFISAHSIQRNGQLSVIAHEGHVYTLSMNVGDLKKNDGSASLVKCGIGVSSTFFGFCDKHDNELFAPIDKAFLVPTSQQVLLYAYRSVCRELFVKENALALIEGRIEALPETSALRRTFDAMHSGTSFSLEALRIHKSALDTLIDDLAHVDIEYVLFTCRQPQFVAFSGLFYPEFNFLGRTLQDLMDPECRLDLLTFCSVPTHNGWGFLFAWHKSSAPTCREFMRSLATVSHEDPRAGADAMFRMVLSNCENTAFSPVWWEQASSQQKAAVLECFNRGVDMFTPTDPAYLTYGAEDVSQWVFDGVYASHD